MKGLGLGFNYYSVLGILADPPGDLVGLPERETLERALARLFPEGVEGWLSGLEEGDFGVDLEGLNGKVAGVCSVEIGEGMDLGATLGRLYAVLNELSSLRGFIEGKKDEVEGYGLYAESVREAFGTWLAKNPDAFLGKLVEGVCGGYAKRAKRLAKRCDAILGALGSKRQELYRYESSLRMYFNNRRTELVYDQKIESYKGAGFDVEAV
jgi:phage shock protein PspC (stress-responsive transcriptional regulator)